MRCCAWVALWICVGATPALGQVLNCSFTLVCSAQTGCQTSPGVPFSFDLSGEDVTFDSPQGPVAGRALPHVAPPAMAILFDSIPGETVLLTLTEAGEAAMTQHSAAATGGIAAISYYGTCGVE